MAQYPTNDSTNDTLYVSVDNVSTVLSAGIDDSVTTIPVISTAGFPSVGFVTMGTEKAKYTSIDATNFLGATRGAGTTTAAAHSLSDPVTHTIVSDHHNNPKDEIIAIAADLRDSFKADLNDSVAPATTATDVKERLDQIVTAHKNATGEVDWKDTPSKTVSDNASDIANNVTDINALKQNILNILANGGMEIWKRGSSFVSPSNGDYTADKWLYNNDGNGTATISQEASVIDTGLNSLKLQINTVGTSTYIRLANSVENWEAYKGKTITVSARVNSDIANAKIAIFDGTFSYSSAHSGGSTWETLSVTRVIPGGASNLQIYIGTIDSIATGTMYYDSIQVVIGDQIIPFIPEDPAIELTRCQRHYQRHGGSAFNEQIGAGTCFSAISASIPFRFPQEMQAVPTITIVGGNNWNCFSNVGGTVTTVSVSSNNPQIKGFWFLPTAPAASFTIGYCTNLWTSTINEYFEAEV